MTHFSSQGEAPDTTSLDILQSGVASTALVTCPLILTSKHPRTHAPTHPPTHAAFAASQPLLALNLIQPTRSVLIATLGIRIWPWNHPIAVPGLLCRGSLPHFLRYLQGARGQSTPRELLDVRPATRGELLQPPHLERGGLAWTSPPGTAHNP